jgi:hypothetical protein
LLKYEMRIQISNVCGLLFIYFFLSLSFPFLCTQNKAVQFEETCHGHKNFYVMPKVLSQETRQQLSTGLLPHSILAPICTHLNPRPPTGMRKKGLLLVSSCQLLTTFSSRAFHLNQKVAKQG